MYMDQHTNYDTRITNTLLNNFCFLLEVRIKRELMEVEREFKTLKEEILKNREKIKENKEIISKING